MTCEQKRMQKAKLTPCPDTACSQPAQWLVTVEHTNGTRSAGKLCGYHAQQAMAYAPDAVNVPTVTRLQLEGA